MYICVYIYICIYAHVHIHIYVKFLLTKVKNRTYFSKMFHCKDGGTRTYCDVTKEDRWKSYISKTIYHIELIYSLSKLEDIYFWKVLKVLFLLATIYEILLSIGFSTTFSTIFENIKNIKGTKYLPEQLFTTQLILLKTSYTPSFQKRNCARHSWIF